MSIEDALAKLQGDDLYEKTGRDWVLEVSHCLTEPTCPTVVIRPEDHDALCRYRVDASTIEEGIERAVDLVYREVIQGERITSPCPFTNPSDKDYEALLERGFASHDPEESE